MPTWVIQRVEALAINGRQDLAKGDKLLFVGRFSNENDFSAAIHEGVIAGVAQDDNDHNKDDDIKTDEDSEEPPGIDLDPESSRGKIGGVPPTEHPVDLPGVNPSENQVKLRGVAPQ